MKKTSLIALIMVTVFAVACAKEEAPVVTEQPAFGEDIPGYAGFSELQSYTLSFEGQDTVLYLPADEAAYIGATSAIINRAGVECKVNLNPMYSEDMKDKGQDVKLSETLKREFEKDPSAFTDLAVSQVNPLGEKGFDAQASYLSFDDATKTYVGEWVDYMYFTLDDGRVVNFRLKVNSSQETEQTQAVIAQLAEYLDVTIPYDAQFLKQKIASYEPDEGEAKKNDATAVNMDDLTFYIPDGYSLDTISTGLAQEYLGPFAGIEIKDVKMFGNEGRSAGNDEGDFIMLFSTDELGLTSGQLGELNAGELSTVSGMLKKEMENSMPGSKLSGTIERIDGIGHGVKLFGTNLSDDDGKRYDGGFLFVVRGTTTYVIAAETPVGSGRLDQLKDTMEFIYDSVEAN